MNSLFWWCFLILYSTVFDYFIVDCKGKSSKRIINLRIFNWLVISGIKIIIITTDTSSQHLVAINYATLIGVRIEVFLNSLSIIIFKRFQCNRWNPQYFVVNGCVLNVAFQIRLIRTTARLYDNNGNLIQHKFDYPSPFVISFVGSMASSLDSNHIFG